MYERLAKTLEDDQSDIAACTVKMVWEDNTPSRLLTVQENSTFERSEAQLALLNETKLKQPVWYKLYKRSVIEGIPFEVGKQHEDVYWSYQVVGNAQRVSIIDYVGYYYLQRDDGIMGDNTYSIKRLDALEAVERRYEYIKLFFPDLERIAKISLVNCCIYHGQMALKMLSKHNIEVAFTYIEQILKCHPLQKDDYKGIKITHKLWLTMSQYSLKIVCLVKNLLKVGL